MIQRIQSIFLVLISVLSVLFVFVPFQQITTEGSTYDLRLFAAFENGIILPSIYIPLLLNFSITLVSFITVFLYKRRELQMKLCSVLAILSCALCVVLLTIVYVKINSVSELNVTYNFYTFLPAVNIILAFIAKRFIKKDDDLVRSADRIR